MSRYIDNFDEVTHAKVINAFLSEAKSHRRIQSEVLNIPAPPRGGGFIVMEILHYYEIRNDKKGILQDHGFSDELKNATGMYKRALELVDTYIR